MRQRRVSGKIIQKEETSEEGCFFFFVGRTQKLNKKSIDLKEKRDYTKYE